MLWGSLWAIVGCKSETMKIKMVTSIDCILGAHILMVVLRGTYNLMLQDDH